MRIKIKLSDGTTRTAVARRTKNPALFITDGREDGRFLKDRFVVTHLPTGYSVIREGLDLETCQVEAEKLVASGIPWK